MNMEQAKAKIREHVAEHGSITRQEVVLIACDVAIDAALDEIFNGKTFTAKLNSGGGSFTPKKSGLIGETGPEFVFRRAGL